MKSYFENWGIKTVVRTKSVTLILVFDSMFSAEYFKKKMEGET